MTRTTATSMTIWADLNTNAIKLTEIMSILSSLPSPPPLCALFADGTAVVPLRTRSEPYLQSRRHEHHFAGENRTRIILR